MRILFLTHAFNSLSQRLFVELRDRGHEVSVEFDINDATAMQAVELFQPELIIAPFLKRAIPEAIWRNHVCLVVHPGIRGDRGPSSLDRAILDGETEWGVTVLQANAVMDGGDIWAHAMFPMRTASKASLYRNEVTEAAVCAVLEAVDRFSAGEQPVPLRYGKPEIRGRFRPLLKQHERAIDWQRDPTDVVLRKIRSADGFPGVIDTLLEREVYLYDVRPASGVRDAPGEVVARCGPALCRATTDGAVWIGHLCDRNSRHPFKLPATCVLARESAHLPEAPGYEDIRYVEQAGVGYLYFDFYNGAMSTRQCERLLTAYRDACGRDTRVIVLLGGADFWSNGMHLNLIEAADSPADESWRNINAIDDLAHEIITTTSHLVVSALQGNAGAGGVFLARAADYVWSRRGVVLNPHYKDMGNLYGSEYWTYLLPRYAGPDRAKTISAARLPMGMAEAMTLGLVDAAFATDHAAFLREVSARAEALARSADYDRLLSAKRVRRAAEEKAVPLARYREQELERMRLNFYGFDPSYHVARYNFVYKVPKSRTPLTLAIHRTHAAHASRRVAK
jgi:putative two-component system hydrogenase maturation factor HypX/HoxX